MKKWIVLLVAMMMVAGVQAKEKGKGDADGMTKEKYVAAQQKRAEKAGKTFDAARAEKMFTAKDKNKDGVLSKDEMTPAKKAE
jgi:hypothetical protein